MSSIKAPRRCLYCGKPGKLTGEHIIANWVRNVIPRVGTMHVSRHMETEYDYSAHKVVISPKVTEKEGHLGNQKLERVCGPCNNGWLKKIQDDTIPVLKPLLKGIWHDFTPYHAEIISLWTCMTVTNIDAAYPYGGGVTQDEIKHFHDKRSVPASWRIWIGRRSGGPGYRYYHRPARIHRPSYGPFKTSPKNSQITTIDLGQVVLHALSQPEPHFFDEETVLAYSDHHGIMPIFPWRGDVVDWHHLPFRTTDQIKQLADEWNDWFARRTIEWAKANHPTPAWSVQEKT